MDSDTTIHTALLDGSSPNALQAPSGGYFVADDTYAYFFGASSAIYSVEGATGVVTKLVDHPHGTSHDSGSLLVDGGNIYWSYSLEVSGNRTIPGSLWQASKTGTSPIELFRKDPGLVAVQGGFVYYDDWDDTSGGLWRVPIGGGAHQRLQSGPVAWDGYEADLLHDDKYFYAFSTGYLFRSPLSGGAIETFVTSATEPRWMAVDATAIVWTTQDTSNTSPNGQLWLLAK